MLTWIIFGGGLPPIKIQAGSFDEAIAKARLRDASYCGGYVVDDD